MPRLRSSRLPLPEEHYEQAALMKWASLRKATVPELELLYACPNGGLRGVITGRRLKEEGVKPGIPDLCLPVARGVWHGLYIELKRRKGGSVSDNQKWWIERLREQGYRATVCFGFDDARQTIEQYMAAGK